MEHNFFEATMSMYTDADLENIVNAPAGAYQQETVETAKYEIEMRQTLKEQFADYSTEKLKLYLSSVRPDTREFQLAIAEVEARRIPTHPKYEIGFSPNKVKNGNSKYPALESITGVLNITAVLLGAVIVIGALLLFAEVSPVSGLLTLIVGGVLVLGLIAMKELIKLFIDIEYNTRNNSK